MPSISSFFVSFSSSSFSFSSLSSSPSPFFLLPPFCPPSHSSSGVTAILSSSWRSSIRRTKGRDHLLADTRVPSRAYRGKTDRCFPSVSSSPIGATSMSSAAYSSLSLSLFLHHLEEEFSSSDDDNHLSFSPDIERTRNLSLSLSRRLFPFVIARVRPGNVPSLSTHGPRLTRRGRWFR